jgi:hypothetical protein
VKQSLLRWSVISAGLGLLAPIAWLLVQKLIGGNTQLAYSLERVIRVVWPSSFWLMATDGIEGTPKAYMFISLSVAANVVLYTLLGSAVWWVKHLLTPAKR